MKNSMQIITSGIKCDNPKCDYIDQSVELKDCPAWLNKPCPKCGSNLLTQDDYDCLMKVVDIVNQCSDQVEDDEPVRTVTLRMNGTGKIGIEVD